MRVLLAVMLSCLICSFAHAERFEGTGDGGAFWTWIYGGGSPGGGFKFDMPITWSARVEVDKSQNVTFQELIGTYSGRLEFDGHGGQVYADIDIAVTPLNTSSLDLNPIPGPDPHVFSILGFSTQIDLSGTYVNRGFENQFAGHYEQNGNLRYFDLSFAEHPDALTLGGREEFPYYYRPGFFEPVWLEPLLGIQEVRLDTSKYSDVSIRMLPVPPDPVLDAVGDSNHNGRFDSGDLVAVFQAGEYEDSIVGNSTWETGDWNADLEFDSGDLVVAFTAGGYESPNEAVAVPEPASVLIVIGAFMWAARRMI